MEMENIIHVWINVCEILLHLVQICRFECWDCLPHINFVPPSVPIFSLSSGVINLGFVPVASCCCLRNFLCITVGGLEGPNPWVNANQMLKV